MHSTDEQVNVATANEADALEQRIPTVPGIQEEPAVEGSTPVAGDPLPPEGSEADRLDQRADGGGVDAGEEEYPRDAAETR